MPQRPLGARHDKPMSCFPFTAILGRDEYTQPHLQMEQLRPRVEMARAQGGICWDLNSGVTHL